MGSGPRIDAVEVSSYTVPTDFPESDGTLEWDSTTLVLAEVKAGDTRGLGYTYASRAAATLINERLREVLLGRDAFAVERAWEAMVRAVRNLGVPGVCASAISAVDAALWDLKARLLDLPLVSLLGTVRESVPVYGSGGFTSYPIERLRTQLSAWTGAGIRMVKMKVGRDPSEDLARVATARQAVGPEAELFVDANGAYSRKQALFLAERFAESGVSWFEEPVPSSDSEGLRFLRDRLPAGMDLAAGEYGYDVSDFRRMLEAGAVDVLQADATRCLGVTGFLKASVLCEAFGVPLSAHTAPSLHAHAGCAALPLRHVEYFHDHVRIERMLFDGVLEPVDGALAPDLDRPGLGIEFKRKDAEKFAV